MYRLIRNCAVLRRILLKHTGGWTIPLDPPTTISSCRDFSSASSDLLEFSGPAAEDVCHMRVLPDFVSAAEEQSVLKEVARALRGRKYQYDHWDEVSCKPRLIGVTRLHGTTCDIGCSYFVWSWSCHDGTSYCIAYWVWSRLGGGVALFLSSS